MICSSCKIDKNETFFFKDKSISRGYKYKCKECIKNKKLSTKPKVFFNGLKWCNGCKEYKKYDHFAFCKSCPNNLRFYCLECGRKFYKDNKEKIKETQKKYVEKNRDIINKNKREYYQNNKYKRNEYIRKRKEKDYLFNIKTAISKNINSKLKRFLKGNKEKNTFEILGCTYEYFASYLESKFESWMTWENRGLYNGELNYGWDLDHIIPLDSAKNDEEVYKLNHYSNFQPLCSKINRDIKWKN